MATPNATSPRRSTFDTIRLPLAALGFFSILAGLGAGLVGGTPELLPRLLVAAGIFLLGIYAALDPEDVWGRLTGRTALVGGNVLVIGIAAVAILGLVNVLGSRYSTKWDLTADKQLSLSDQSIRVAEALPQPVHATAFFSTNDSQRQQFQTLLSDYANRSGGKLTYDFVDPDVRPGDAIQAGITQVGTTVYQMGDKKQNSTGATERDISTALVKLTRPEKKVYFTTGHGERNLDGNNQPDYGQIKQALARDNFTVDTLNPTTTRAVPDDAAAVIVAGPTSPFLKEELDTLSAYLDGGGKLFILLDPGSKADFNDLLGRWGVAFTKNLVVEPSQNYLNDVRVPVVSKYGSHVTTADLRIASFFPGTTNVTYPPDAGGATITAIAQTSDQSWGNTSQQQIQRQDSDPKGPLTVALAIEQPVGAPAGQSGQSAPDAQGGKKTRVYLVGSANLVANAFLNVASGNQDLFLNATNWLAEEENVINVRAPSTVSRTMPLTGPQLNLVMYSSLLFLPLLVLAAGVAVWWTRR